MIMHFVAFVVAFPAMGWVHLMPSLKQRHKGIFFGSLAIYAVLALATAPWGAMK